MRNLLDQPSSHPAPAPMRCARGVQDTRSTLCPGCSRLRVDARARAGIYFASVLSAALGLGCGSERPPWSGFDLFPADAGLTDLPPGLWTLMPPGGWGQTATDEAAMSAAVAAAGSGVASGDGQQPSSAGVPQSEPTNDQSTAALGSAGAGVGSAPTDAQRALDAGMTLDASVSPGGPEGWPFGSWAGRSGWPSAGSPGFDPRWRQAGQAGTSAPGLDAGLGDPPTVEDVPSSVADGGMATMATMATMPESTGTDEDAGLASP